MTNDATLHIPPGRRILFLDDWVIESSANVCRRIEPLRKQAANPLIVPDRPWEGCQALLYGSVLRDGATGRYRIWYLTGIGLGDTDHQAMGYAESDDGLVWSKPLMDAVCRDGQPTNLVIRRGDWLPHHFFFEPFGVLDDPADPDPQRRFKFLYLSLEFNSPKAWNPKIKGSRRGVGCAVSPDGLRWTPESDWTSEAIIDISQALYDPALREFMLYGRDHVILPEIERAWGGFPWFKANYWGRVVVRLTSPDLRRWSEPQLVMAADKDDPPGSDVYTMSVFPYEGLYIGMVQRYINNPDDPERDGTLDYQYAVSHDGIRFERVGDRAPCLALGGVGAWDRFNQSIANRPVRVGDELRFYYSGRTCRHTPAAARSRETGPHWGAIGLATTPRDRFAALTAGFDGGTVVTKPFPAPAGGLRVNLCAPAGRVGVEVLDEQAQPIQGLSAEVRGDALDACVPLPADRLAAVAGRRVRLRFSLANARLYSFGFAD